MGEDVEQTDGTTDGAFVVQSRVEKQSLLGQNHVCKTEIHLTARGVGRPVKGLSHDEVLLEGGAPPKPEQDVPGTNVSIPLELGGMDGGVNMESGACPRARLLGRVSEEEGASAERCRDEAREWGGGVRSPCKDCRRDRPGS